ncbi:DUF3224 domain-containing protein [Microbacterium sp. YY-01]|uniref:DUF3224 domain-containing protein n=1 Tax=Microbacterium sp. YY-01 TaxID=3421634 RepID=UPI003D181272
MRATATFTVEAFTPLDVTIDGAPETATPVGVSQINKRYDGEVSGTSTTVFTYARNPETGAGAYVAMESFEGSLHDRAGTFNFMHSATTTGEDRANEFFLIAPASGTGDLAGIEGTGGITIDADGTHHMWFDYEFSA